jgi:hypothetical protein
MPACKEGGWAIDVRKQPPISPDLNVLDLEFFCSIQALQHEFTTASIDALIKCTVQAFAELSATKLDDTFLSLQQVMGVSSKILVGTHSNNPTCRKRSSASRACCRKTSTGARPRFLPAKRPVFDP